MDVGKFFGFADIYIYIILALVHADYHPFIDGNARAYERGSTFLNRRECVGCRYTAFKRDKNAVSKFRNMRRKREIADKLCSKDTLSAGFGHDIAPEAQKVAAGDFVEHPGNRPIVCMGVQKFCAAFS